MIFLKKITLALFVTFAMIAVSPSAMAKKPMGKIENASPEATAIAIDETLVLAEETLAAIKSGVEKDVVMKMFKATKQKAKAVESTVTYMLREKSLGKLGKARSAFKKGKTEKAAELMAKALESFKKLKYKYDNF
jgi:hypothetical protein